MHEEQTNNREMQLIRQEKGDVITYSVIIAP